MNRQAAILDWQFINIIKTVPHEQESRAVAGNPRDAAVIFDP